MDLYYPASHPASTSDRQPPAVAILLGYPDVAVPLIFGCQFREKEMGMTISWAQLFAASGMVGVVYETRNPAADAEALLDYLRDNDLALGIDGTRLGVWSSSGNVPVALTALMNGKARCGALCYGFMLDLDEATGAGQSTGVAQASAQFRFANPASGRRVEDLPRETPLFIARAGADQFPGLNQSIDAFVSAALRLNLPVALMNHPAGPHAFDLL